MTEFIVTRLKGADHRDWMTSRSSLRHAIITGELSVSSLVKVVSNIVGVWPLIVVYLKESGRQTDGDSLVVSYILHFYFSCNFFHYFILLSSLEKWNPWVLLRQPDAKKQIPPVPSDFRDG